MTYSDTFRAEVVAAVRELGLVQPVARAYGVTHGTVDRWRKAEGVVLRPSLERMQIGGAMGTLILWPDNVKRRAKARRMRAAGATLNQIRAKLGYHSIASVHYAVK